MRRVWAWMGLNFGKHAGIVGVIGLAITLVLGLGITRLDFATGQDSYLNKDEQVYKDSVAYQDLFGGQAMVSLFTMDEGLTVTDLFTPENIAHMQQIDEDLRDIDGVLTVVSPLTALQFTQNMVTGPPDAPDDVAQSVAGQALLDARAREPTPEGQAARLEDAATTLSRIGAVTGPHEFDNPEWIDFLLFDNRGEIRKSLRPFFPDETHAQTITRLVGNQSLEGEGAASERIQQVVQAEPFSGATTTTTGASVLLKDLNDYLRGGMLTLGAIAVGIMVVILVLLFGVRWRLLPLFVILVGVTWAFGLAGYLGIPLSVVTIAGLPVMLGVGIDYAIQMHSRIEEEVIVDRAPHPIQEASMNLGPALLVVTFDAVFAFLALRYAKVPMIRHFGTLLAVGIAAICVCSIVLPLAILGIREYRSPTKGRDWSRGNLAKLVVWLGNMPARAAVPLIVVSVAVFIGGVVVEDQLTIQSDPEEWVNQDTQVIRDIDTLKRETGSSAELGIFVQSDDVFSDETVAFVTEFANEQLAERPDELLTASSLPTTVAFLLETPGTTLLSPTGARLRGGTARHPAGPGQPRRRRPQPGVPNGAWLARRAGRVHQRDPRRARGGRDRRRRHRARGRAGHPVGPGRGGRRPAGEHRGQPHPAHLPGGPVRVPVPHRPAAQRRTGAAVDGAGAHRGGRRVAGRLGARPAAQPYDRGRRPARRRPLHRVHVADPAAVHRGAAPRLLAP
jgi:uncharacterized protein